MHAPQRLCTFASFSGGCSTHQHKMLLQAVQRYYFASAAKFSTRLTSKCIFDHSLVSQAFSGCNAFPSTTSCRVFNTHSLKIRTLKPSNCDDIKKSPNAIKCCFSAGPFYCETQLLSTGRFYSSVSKAKKSVSRNGSESKQTNKITSDPKSGQNDNIDRDSSAVSFGFETVSSEEKARRVQGVFSSVADKYDFMNDLMSLGIQRWWKAMFVDLIEIPINYKFSKPNSEANNKEVFRLLDLAGGTGDISFRFLEKYRGSLPAGSKSISGPEIIVCDANEEMLRVGKSRAESSNFEELSWVCANGENLPFEDSLFDVVTIAFGIRNFANVSKGLQEMHRVLKPGGRFLCLEFSKVDNPALSFLYNFWSFYVIPFMGEFVASDRKAYQYLVESIAKFPSQKDFSRMIWESGFQSVSHMDLTGGIVAIHSGYKQTDRSL